MSNFRERGGKNMTTGSSLLTPEITTMVSGFAGNIIPTVMAVLVIVVPVGLTAWAIGFGIKKGIGYLQRKAAKAV